MLTNFFSWKCWSYFEFYPKRIIALNSLLWRCQMKFFDQMFMKFTRIFLASNNCPWNCCHFFHLQQWKWRCMTSARWLLWLHVSDANVWSQAFQTVGLFKDYGKDYDFGRSKHFLDLSIEYSNKFNFMKFFLAREIQFHVMLFFFGVKCN